MKTLRTMELPAVPLHALQALIETLRRGDEHAVRAVERVVRDTKVWRGTYAAIRPPGLAAGGRSGGTRQTVFSNEVRQAQETVFLLDERPLAPGEPAATLSVACGRYELSAESCDAMPSGISQRTRTTFIWRRNRSEIMQHFSLSDGRVLITEGTVRLVAIRDDSLLIKTVVPFGSGQWLLPLFAEQLDVPSLAVLTLAHNRATLQPADARYVCKTFAEVQDRAESLLDHARERLIPTLAIISETIHQGFPNTPL